MQLHASTIVDQAESAPAAITAGPGARAIPFHPLASLFPLLEGAAFDGLVEDVRVNGQRDDIVIFGGMILDGRNRFRACLMVGVEPRCRDFGAHCADGNDPQAFVLSLNLIPGLTAHDPWAQSRMPMDMMRQG
jgi:hypothetical protein